MRNGCLTAVLAMFLAGPVLADTRAGATAFKQADFETALKELQPEGEKGDATALYYLGRMYQAGLGVEKDAKKAIEYLAKAAEGDNADAQFLYGQALVLGEGVEADFVEGVKWLFIAGRVNGHEGALEQTEKLLMPRETAAEVRKLVGEWAHARGKHMRLPPPPKRR